MCWPHAHKHTTKIKESLLDWEGELPQVADTCLDWVQVPETFFSVTQAVHQCGLLLLAKKPQNSITFVFLFTHSRIHANMGCDSRGCSCEIHHIQIYMSQLSGCVVLAHSINWLMVNTQPYQTEDHLSPLCDTSCCQQILHLLPSVQHSLGTVDHILDRNNQNGSGAILRSGLDFRKEIASEMCWQFSGSAAFVCSNSAYIYGDSRH